MAESPPRRTALFSVATAQTPLQDISDDLSVRVWVSLAPQHINM